MEVLVCAGCTSQIQTGHCDTGSREETIEQHDTPQQPMTGHIQKREGSTHHQAKDNLESSKYQVIDRIVKSARKIQSRHRKAPAFCDQSSTDKALGS